METQTQLSTQTHNYNTLLVDEVLKMDAIVKEGEELSFFFFSLPGDEVNKEEHGCYDVSPSEEMTVQELIEKTFFQEYNHYHVSLEGTMLRCRKIKHDYVLINVVRGNFLRFHELHLTCIENDIDLHQVMEERSYIIHQSN